MRMRSSSPITRTRIEPRSILLDVGEEPLEFSERLDPTEQVEGSEVRDEREVGAERQALGIEPEGQVRRGATESGVQLPQGCGQPPEVGGRPAVAQVDVQGGQGRAPQDGGLAADHDVLHPVPAEDLSDPEEPWLLGAFVPAHGAPVCPARASRGDRGARAARGRASIGGARGPRPGRPAPRRPGRPRDGDALRSWHEFYNRSGSRVMPFPARAGREGPPSHGPRAVDIPGAEVRPPRPRREEEETHTRRPDHGAQDTGKGSDGEVFGSDLYDLGSL